MQTSTPAALDELEVAPDTRPLADVFHGIADEYDAEAQAHHRARRAGRCTYARSYADAMRLAAYIAAARAGADDAFDRLARLEAVQYLDSVTA